MLKKFFDWFRSTRSKSEIQDKVTELIERFNDAAEGRTITEAESYRMIICSRLQALDWVIKEREKL